MSRFWGGSGNVDQSDSSEAEDEGVLDVAGVD